MVQHVQCPWDDSTRELMRDLYMRELVQDMWIAKQAWAAYVTRHNVFMPWTRVVW